MPFDTEAARKAGYSDDEIVNHLAASRNFDVQGARDAGYGTADVLDYLSKEPAAAPTAGMEKRAIETPVPTTEQEIWQARQDKRAWPEDTTPGSKPTAQRAPEPEGYPGDDAGAEFGRPESETATMVETLKSLPARLPARIEATLAAIPNFAATIGTYAEGQYDPGDTEQLRRDRSINPPGLPGRFIPPRIRTDTEQAAAQDRLESTERYKLRDEQAAEAQARYRETLPDKPEGLLGQMIGGAGESSPEMGAGIAAGMVGGPVPGIAVGVGLATLSQGAAAWQETKDMAFALRTAMYEAAGELYGMKAILKPAKKFLNDVGVMILKNMGEEASTGFAQGVDRRLTQDDMTLGEALMDPSLWEEVVVSGGAGVIGAGAVVPIIKGQQIAQEGQRDKQMEQLAAIETERRMLRKMPADDVAAMLLNPNPPVPRYEGFNVETGRMAVDTPDAGLPDTAVGALEPGATTEAMADEMVQLAITQQGLTPSAEELETALTEAGQQATGIPYGSSPYEQSVHNTGMVRDEKASSLAGLSALYSTQDSHNQQPFSPAQAEPGAVNVFAEGRANVDPAFAAEVGQLVKSWLDTILPERPAANVRIGPIKGFDSKPFGAANFYDNGQLSIQIDPELSEVYRGRELGRAAAIETLAHEVFHIIAPVLLRRSPKAMRDAVYQAWRDDMKRALEMTPKEFAEAFRGSTDIFAQRQAYYADDRTVAEIVQEEQRLAPEDRFYEKYLMNFDEWMAHNGERVLSGQVYGWSRQMRKFMQQTYNTWRKLFGKYDAASAGVNPTFKQFVDYHIAKTREGFVHELEAGHPGILPAAEGGTASMELSPPQSMELIKSVQPTVIAKKIKKIFTSAGSDNADAFGREMDKFSWWQKLSFTLLQVAKANPHIRELYDPLGRREPGETETIYGYNDYVLKFNNEQMFWASRADERERQWRKLSTTENENLAQFMYDQRAEGKYFNLEDGAVLEQYKLTEASIELYRKLDGDFKAFISAVEEARIAEAMKRLKDNPFVTTEIASIRKAFEQLRSIPYVPEIRFGNYIVRVVAAEDTVVDGKTIKKGQTIERQHTEYSIQQVALATRLGKEYPKHIVKMDKLPEGLESLTSMPRALLDALKMELHLDEEQQKALDDYMYRTAPSQSFVRRLIRRQGVRGFSFDLQRAYAQYFMFGSKHLARIRYGGSLAEAVKRLHDTAGAIDELGPQKQDAVKRRQIANYATRHMSHLLTPVNDWAALRATVAVSYLSGMMRTAVANLTQPAFTTYPELAREYGDGPAVKAIWRAYKDSYKTYHALKPMTQAQEAIINKWVNGEELTSGEDAYVTKWSGLELELRDALLQAQRENVIDQSQAMELAAMSEGNWMYRFRASSELGYYARTGAQALMIPFQMAEKLNRRVSFVSAFRLARDAGLDSAYAYQKAVDSVRTTQFEYSKAFRPELLRGKKGVMFMFMQFPLSSLHFATNGYSKNVGSWQWRWWALMLASGGLLGLPFAENLKDLAEWALIQAFPNKKINVKYEMKKLLKEFTDNIWGSPDIFLHGASRYGFGIMPAADMSGSMSMGRLIPGTDVPLMIAQGADWGDAVARAVTEAGGATSTLMMRMLQALASDDVDEWRRLERGAPMSLAQSVSAAFRWAARGAETDRSGAVLAEFDTNDPWQMAEIAGKALGFTPRRLNEKKDEIYTRRDFARYYDYRRSMLMTELDDAARRRDKHAVNQAVEAIRRYNKEVPARAYMISGEQIRDSVKNRNKRRARIEGGFGATKREESLRQDYESGRL